MEKNVNLRSRRSLILSIYLTHIYGDSSISFIEQMFLRSQECEERVIWVKIWKGEIIREVEGDIFHAKKTSCAVQRWKRTKVTVAKEKRWTVRQGWRETHKPIHSVFCRPQQWSGTCWHRDASWTDWLLLQWGESGRKSICPTADEVVPGREECSWW